MIFWHTFLNSLKLPKQKAMFTLNRNGMDITVIYLFILFFFVSLPTFIEQMTSPTGSLSTMNGVFSLIYFFMFSYLPLAIIVFLLLSLIAYIGTWVAKFLKRRLHFSLLWKMSAYLTTVPFLIYTVLAFLFPINDSFLGAVLLLYTSLLLIKIITVYPKRQ